MRRTRQGAPAARVVDGAGAGPLDDVVRQLWGPALGGDLRVTVAARGAARPAPAPGRRVVEEYWAVPDAGRARLLVPAASRRVTAAALTAYPGLRPPRVRLVRALLALAARCGAPPGRDLVQVDAPDGEPGPVALAARAAGADGAHAAVGVRRGANAKPTLQLLDAVGRPVGFAKLAWDVQSADFVRVEDETLVAVAASADASVGSVTQGARDVRSARVHAPRVLGRGERGGYPYVVTEPLPRSARRPGPADAPGPAELLALAPVVRTAPAAATAHVRDIGARLRSAAAPTDAGEGARLLERALALHGALEEEAAPVLVAARWHGDLVPWNAARDADGVLWVWDWETAEPDVVAGLDGVHWIMNAPRPAPDRVPDALRRREGAIRSLLAGVGHDARAQDVVLAVYVLALAERGLSLARARGSWAQVLVGPEPLRVLVDAAYRVICPVG